MKQQKSSTLRVLAVAALGLMLIPSGMVGCTGQQVNTVVTDISQYLPTVLALLQDGITIYGALAVSPNTPSPASAALATVQADVAALQQPIKDYLAASALSGTKATYWTNIQALVDTATKDADQLMQIAAVKDPGSQAAGVVVISSLDAAIHVLDGYVSSAQTPQQVAAKAAARSIKVSSVVKYWSRGDKQIVAKQFGAPFGLVLAEAESEGF